MRNLHLLIQRLADSGVEFIIVGGMAGVLHGSTYVTEDLDICAVLSPENVERLRAALRDLKPAHRLTHRKLSFIDHPPEGTALANLYLETEAGVVDILGSVLGLGKYEELSRNAVEVFFFGRKCRVVSLADLIRAKEAVGREKDLLVAKELRAIAAKRAGL